MLRMRMPGALVLTMTVAALSLKLQEHVAATPAPPIATIHVGDDWDELYGVMENMLSVMDDMDQHWSASMNDTIVQIGVMADRIVYTETLITDEGLQIGDMADRIVKTEYILSNMTSHCLNCSHVRTNKSDPHRTLPNAGKRGTTIASPSETRLSASRQRQQLLQRSQQQQRNVNMYNSSISFDSECITCKAQQLMMSLKTSNTSSITNTSEARDDPILPLLQFMNHTLNLMESMSDNVSSEMDFMDDQIGVMANRIVGTECLIMNMSKQIGIMANRIVLTERMMSNVSVACCQLDADGVVETASAVHPAPGVQPLPPNCNASASASGHKNDNPRAVTSRSLLRFKSLRDALQTTTMHHRNAHPASHSSNQTCSPLDPVCIAIEAMTAMAIKMENIMYSMCLQMLNETTAGALEIGKLADDIVSAEGDIIDMSDQIGQLANGIVHIESAMCSFAVRVCHSANSTCATTTTGAHSGALGAFRGVIGRDNNSPKPGDQRDHASAPSVHPSNVANIAVQSIYDIQFRAATMQHEARQRFDVMRGALDLMAALITRVAPTPPTMTKPTTGDSNLLLPNPIKWMNLMRQLMQKMVVMSVRLLANMNEIMGGMASMGTRISKTVGLIGAMGAQITHMVARMAETATIVDDLIKDCKL
eukprot:m.13579 g.13579  ORF g.13579 m.13579 type:complete len:651 (-) comp9778_c0_seq1:54-2006(-)